MPDGTLKILVEGRCRGRVQQFHTQSERGFLQVDVEELSEICPITPEIEALQRECVQLFEQFVKLDRRISLDVVTSVNGIENPARLADTLAGNLLIKISEKQALL